MRASTVLGVGARAGRAHAGQAAKGEHPETLEKDTATVNVRACNESRFPLSTRVSPNYPTTRLRLDWGLASQIRGIIAQPAH